MKLIRNMLLTCLLPFSLFAAEMRHTMAVTIEYGDGTPQKNVTTHYRKGENALEVLARVAEVKSYRVGEYLFVRSIDGIAGTPGEMGWFFSIDGLSADKTASSYILKDAASMEWELRRQNCLSR